MKCPGCGSELKKGARTCVCGEFDGNMTPEKARQGEKVYKVRKSLGKVFLTLFGLSVLVIGVLIFLATKT